VSNRASEQVTESFHPINSSYRDGHLYKPILSPQRRELCKKSHRNRQIRVKRKTFVAQYLGLGKTRVWRTGSNLNSQSLWLQDKPQNITIDSGTCKLERMRLQRMRQCVVFPRRTIRTFGHVSQNNVDKIVGTRSNDGPGSEFEIEAAQSSNFIFSDATNTSKSRDFTLQKQDVSEAAVADQQCASDSECPNISRNHVAFPQEEIASVLSARLPSRFPQNSPIPRRTPSCTCSIALRSSKANDSLPRQDSPPSDGCTSQNLFKSRPGSSSTITLDDALLTDVSSDFAEVTDRPCQIPNKCARNSSESTATQIDSVREQMITPHSTLQNSLVSSQQCSGSPALQRLQTRTARISPPLLTPCSPIFQPANHSRSDLAVVSNTELAETNQVQGRALCFDMNDLLSRKGGKPTVSEAQTSSKPRLPTTNAIKETGSVPTVDSVLDIHKSKSPLYEYFAIKSPEFAGLDSKEFDDLLDQSTIMLSGDDHKSQQATKLCPVLNPHSLELPWFEDPGRPQGIRYMLESSNSLSSDSNSHEDRNEGHQRPQRMAEPSTSTRSPGKPIVRGLPPRPCGQRSPIAGLSASTVLRTCFRIGEALKYGSSAVRNDRDTVIELYARVIASNRDGAKQVFTFADIFHDHPPYVEGFYELWKGVDLWDLDSCAFLGDRVNGGLCRCMCRMRQTDGDWKLQILSIWSATYEDVAHVKGIVDP
jgi:hypothetical protein